MPRLPINGIDLAYQRCGERGGPVLLMIQGLGMPLTAWPDSFVTRLAAAGLDVLLLDNRDIGQSQTSGPAPRVAWQVIRRALGLGVKAHYSLGDMAADASGLLDGLGIESAHVVGISMGGMIAQVMALEHRQKLRSLTSIMSTTGQRDLPDARAEIVRKLISRPRSDALAVKVEHQVGLWRLIGSPAYPVSDDKRREFVQQNFERGVTTEGAGRQLLAVAAAPDRTADLNRLDLPTLVIHGALDPLVPVQHGYATAAAIAGARLRVIAGMGHDLPDEVLPLLANLIISHVYYAEVAAAGPIPPPYAPMPNPDHPSPGILA